MKVNNIFISLGQNRMKGEGAILFLTKRPRALVKCSFMTEENKTGGKAPLL